MFSSWFHELVLFIFAVGAHWQALATGGIVTALVGVYEKKRNVSLSWQSYATIITAFLLYSVFAAWQDEHRNSQTLISEKATISSSVSACKNDLSQSESLAKFFQTQVAGRDSTINSQGETLNTCVVALAKGLVVSPRIITNGYTFSAIRNSANSQDRTAIIVARTNVNRPSFRGHLKCLTSFDAYEVVLSEGAISMTMGTSRSSQTDLDINFGTTAWRVEDQIFVLLHGNDLNPLSCTITE